MLLDNLGWHPTLSRMEATHWHIRVLTASLASTAAVLEGGREDSSVLIIEHGGVEEGGGACCPCQPLCL